MPKSLPTKSTRILVLGATGYVGARLVPRLLSAGYQVRAVSRSLEKLKSCNWAKHPNVELISADVLNPKDLKAACASCDAAYYFVHSMNAQHKDFAEADRLAAHNMVAAAKESGLKRIIYLGGLGEQSDNLSAHLRSRSEVADILTSGDVPVTVLRAAMIIGSGSASFEILRYLVDRLPFMITPRWVRTPSQPIAIRNVLTYLLGCLECDETIGQVFDIGGPEVITYQQLMDEYAEESGLGRRFVIPVPYFTPRLSSYWIHLVTPVPAYIGRPLAEGLRNPAVCKESRIRALIPQELLDCRTATQLAITCLQHEQAESHRTYAGAIPPAEWFNTQDPRWAGGTVYEDKRSVLVDGTPGDLWQQIVRLGDGRRQTSELKPGDTLGFGKVVAVERGKRLLVAAKMRLPGKAMLEFTIEPLSATQVRLWQTVKFLPSGLTGIIFWWLATPLRNAIFRRLLHRIASARPERQVSHRKKLRLE